MEYGTYFLKAKNTVQIASNNISAIYKVFFTTVNTNYRFYEECDIYNLSPIPF